MQKIGAHVSIEGGFLKALDRARNIGAETIQIFGASPVQWKADVPSKKEGEEFWKAAQDKKINPIFLHAPYLINLASPKKQLAAMSRELLAKHLKISNALHANGVIFHVGSRGDQDQKEGEKIVISALKKILEEVPEGRLLVENSAGAGNLVGDTLEEVGNILNGVSSDRVGFCYDTAHGFESGVLTKFSSKALDEFEKKLENLVGTDRVWAIHANDSKTPADSNKDRHENIGEGYIGEEGFRSIIKHSVFKDAPFILEVPGFNEEGPDKKNIERLRSYAESS